VLLEHNARVGVPGAASTRDEFLAAARAMQDTETGLWLGDHAGAPGRTEAEIGPLTPHINRTFHVIKFLYNTRNLPVPHAERMIDSCLAARDDVRFYSWETGFACNDLDLALVLYSASRWTDHRRQEIRDWARERLPLILAVQKPDGGFSFEHERAMQTHLRLRISPGVAEGDLWGTLMYLGTVKMMVHLGYPEVTVPWGFSTVHAVPEGVST
jgi:hypothetical protein